MDTKLLNKAYVFSLITIFYNLVEGGVATFLAQQMKYLNGAAHIIWRM